MPAKKDSVWTCPACARKNQPHDCGTGLGSRDAVLRDRPPALAQIYDAIETFVTKLGPVEIVAKERYVLLRTVRIFADLNIMTDALRIAIHLQRRVDDPIFFKVATEGKKVTHVAKLRTLADLRVVKQYLKEAYTVSLPEK